MFGTIRKQLSAFSVVVLVLIALMGAISLYAVRQLNGALSDVEVSSKAMRNHMQGDMMHDAMRADVLGAQIAATKGDASGLADATKDLGEHYKDFAENMAANRELALRSETQEATKAAMTVIAAYDKAAREAQAALGADAAAAQPKVDAFLALFSTLEKQMADVRDLIEADVKATSDKGAALAAQVPLVLGIAFAVVGVLTLLIAWRLVRNIVGSLDTLRGVVQKVNAGDMTARAKLVTRDELGEFGGALDKLLDERIAQLGVAAKENEQLNNSVIALIQTVFQLSNKDLTAQAAVSEDVIGTLSASINQLTHSTGSTLAEVQQIASQVREASEFVNEQASRVDETAQGERQALEHMAGQLQRATKQLMQVAQLSDDSNKAAEKASTATDGALRAVSATVRGMDDLRESISETEKRFKRLGERSQEISSAVGLINTISERTHMLAMNASMQAATAGEAGRGFAVVAEEVQRLSESSRQATTTISQLVQNIQLETNETLYTMNRLISQVVSQSEQAQAAGEQMTLTQTTTTQLVTLVQQIAQFSDQQSLLARELQLSVSKLDKGSEQTVTAISMQTRSTATLVDFSRRLADAVGQFKLPQAA